MTCSNCGAEIPPGSKFCERCGTPVASAPAAYSSMDMPVVTGFESAPQAHMYSGSDPLLEFDVDYPESLSRWKIFVKWLLVIPHWFVLYILAFVAWIVIFIAWFAILITGRFPRGMWDFMLLYLRWTANVTTYAFTLQRDEYPPFGDAAYPARLNLEYPAHLSRLLIFVKWLLIIPHLLVWWFVGLAAFVAIVITWFAILITGNYPRGLFEFVTGSLRWLYRINAYVYLMTDKYPPFSLD
jgi:hypothetical protein